MKQKYEKTILTITFFAEDDVITTSEYDRHNAYRRLSDLNDSGDRLVPNR